MDFCEPENLIFLVLIIQIMTKSNMSMILKIKKNNHITWKESIDKLFKRVSDKFLKLTLIGVTCFQILIKILHQKLKMKLLLTVQIKKWLIYYSIISFTSTICSFIIQESFTEVLCSCESWVLLEFDTV